MLETMAGLKPGFGWLLPIPFYFMELLVGLVQALVFMLLCAVFTLLICQHEEAVPADGTQDANDEFRQLCPCSIAGAGEIAKEGTAYVRIHVGSGVKRKSPRWFGRVGRSAWPWD